MSNITLTELLTEIVSEICDNYCKFSEKYDVKNIASDEDYLLYVEHCEKCPFCRLGVYE